MKKDVIYIDIEDDITTVIEKIKNATEKIVALVPPKGSAVLQSVVNLKLVQRAAKGAKKQPVLITNNQALLALAGGLGMYAAKNLQSKPFVPGGAVEEPADDAVEVSDEVGDLEADAGTTVDLHDTDESEMELSSEELASLDDPADDNQEPEKKDSKKAGGKKIPNFNNFRKKLLISGGALILLAVVLVAVFGKTKADVAIRAETTPVDVLLEAAVNANSTQSDIANRNLRAQIQESKKTVTQSFAATGEKDLGTKASGEMTFSIRCNDVDGSPPTIPAGTGVSSDGLTFITQTATSLTTPSFNGGCRFTGDAIVFAQNNGDQYNLSARNYTVSGFSDVTGRGEQMTGGTSRIVKVISQGDIDKAREQLNQQDVNTVREELRVAFGDNVTVLEDTFTTTFGNVVSEPAVDQEANEGRLTAEVTYSILALANDDLGALLDTAITEQMTNKEQQRVYKNGLEGMKLEKLSGDARTATFRISALGYYGPQFNEEELKNQITGKKVGEVRSYLQDLPGVKSIDISLSPFWARNAPSPSRINITIEVDDNAGSN